MQDRKAERQRRLAESKRRIILDAARQTFVDDGLERASLRAIATKAGYTPAALYFHFESKEAIYAELLRDSLAALGQSVARAVKKTEKHAERFRAAAMAFFWYYAKHPSELDLGFYLFRGGMKPQGLSRESDRELNAALASSLRPLSEAALAMGVDERKANEAMVDIFAHATGRLLLLQTGRIRMFGASAEKLMDQYVALQIDNLSRKKMQQ